MTKYYGDERLETRAKYSATTTSLALKLEQEMWMSQSKTADDVFNYLKLDKKGGDIFEDSALSTWVSYVNKLNKYKERPDEFAVISILEKRFDYLDLARMLGNMRGREAETVASLRKLQFKQWMTEKRLDAKGVERLLLHPDDKKNLRVYLDYNDFYNEKNVRQRRRRETKATCSRPLSRKSVEVAAQVAGTELAIPASEVALT
ncbi:hypothetical protein GQ600_10942 [Phytophthora cactorum]|nr:hypothetical protein GQ600_10942 [Phytophthora cactorum]